MTEVGIEYGEAGTGVTSHPESGVLSSSVVLTQTYKWLMLLVSE